ncbi:hypothetical protein CIB48_g318 [Xylaria polymorpha]|nr:hypothetical protein CIB48_g318 [Xylaria polymorpha]
MMPMFDSSEPIPLSSRFAKLKRNMIACREKDVAESFYRLLRALRKEADDIAARGSDVIPTIDYFDIHDSAKASAFRRALRKRGVAVIKRVVPLTVAQTWKDETLDYVADNRQARGYPLHDPQLFDLYWSPSQVRARVDSRLLDAQRFAMRIWHASDEQALVSGEYPVVYADRLRVRTPPRHPPRGRPRRQRERGALGTGRVRGVGDVSGRVLGPLGGPRPVGQQPAAAHHDGPVQPLGFVQHVPDVPGVPQPVVGARGQRHADGVSDAAAEHGVPAPAALLHATIQEPGRRDGRLRDGDGPQEIRVGLPAPQ